MRRRTGQPRQARRPSPLCLPLNNECGDGAEHEPGQHRATARGAACPDTPALRLLVLRSGGDALCFCECRQQVGGIPDPAKDAALCFDHFQCHALEFRKIGSDAVGEH